MNEALLRLQKGLIVSCQALDNEPLHGSELMAKMALAAKWGGAHGIRANTPQDIQAIHQVVDIPVIGIYKYHYPSFYPYITPTFREAKLVAEAGADIIAIDATSDPHPVEAVGDLIHRIHDELGLSVMADTSTVEEAVDACKMGADVVATTLRGYTHHTRGVPSPDIAFLKEVVSAVDCPVIAEGGIRTPDRAREALEAGAFAVVVGRAITSPQDVVGWYLQEMQKAW